MSDDGNSNCEGIYTLKSIPFSSSFLLYTLPINPLSLSLSLSLSLPLFLLSTRQENHDSYFPSW